MFGKAIWDKFSKVTRMIYPKNCPQQRLGYWLITPNQKHFVMKLIYFNSGQLQNSGQIQNNSVYGAMLITINRVIRSEV